MSAEEWQRWISARKPDLQKNYGYELFFARDVLTRVPGLDPMQVEHQFKFVDTDDRRRRADFLIKTEHHRVIVEVDGFDKTGRGSGMTPAEFDDFLARQNSTTVYGWKILRFSNTQVKNDPAGCAATIQKAIKEPVASKPAAITSTRPDTTRPAATPRPTSAASGAAPTRTSLRSRVPVIVGMAVVAMAIAIAVSMSGGGTDESGGVAPVSLNRCPSHAPIKGNVTDERIFHRPSDEFYDRTNPEVCFESADDAEAEGFRPARR